MQTTLRIESSIYREAKAEAAREGLTITRFIEEALRLRLRRPAARKNALPAYDSGVRVPAGYDLPAAVREAQARYGESLAGKTSSGTRTPRRAAS